ncbi:MAG TPA: LPXTG cell wall anchor domain-containing protein, partial [Polyangiaceae bacterium]|nr:LPXTG cell wall anchor domain-containing protein [Polyangiaceae bacterium]
YEAGEYRVSIHDARNDQLVGAPVTLIFDGENEVIDRRAMVFSGNDKKKKPDADTKKVADDKPAASDDKKSDDAAPASDSDAGPAPAPAGDEPKPSDEPQTIKEKPGGCGCRLADTGEDGNAGLGFAALALSAVVLRRRKKHAA